MMMPEPLFTIHETLYIKGRGIVLLALLDREGGPPVRVRIGDEIALTTEDGACIKTTVRGVELGPAGPPDKFPLGLLVALPSEDAPRLRGAKAQVVQVGEGHL
jgi:hypothetical protein